MATPDTDRSQARHGLIYGVLAYGSWGLLAIYPRQLKPMPSMAILAHRVSWSLIFLLLLIGLQNKWRELFTCFTNRRVLIALIGSTLMIAVNWFTFIYAVNSDRMLQASLGYFMNPLVNVLLGTMILKERLRPGQLIGLALAAAGMLWLTIHNGQFPVIAITLAVSFGLYALLRKTMSVGPLVGLTVETALLFPITMTIVVHQFFIDSHSTSGVDHRVYSALLCAGVITATPLLWFTAAARRLRLSTMGFLQYLSPTGQFLVAVLIYHEPLDRAKLIAFGFIWIALVIYTIDSLRGFGMSRRDAALELAAIPPAD